jgi:starvation-inducible DNA-binding protein
MTLDYTRRHPGGQSVPAPWRGAKKATMKTNNLSIPAEYPNTGLLPRGVVEIAEELRNLLADTLALYMKTKAFHWHMSGPHFRDYHLLLDQQATEILDITDDIAERSRKLGSPTLHSIGDITRHQRLRDDDREFVAPEEMLRELMSDNHQLTSFLRIAHDVCDRNGDVATASLIEVWIDQAEGRGWFLAAIVLGLAAERDS